MQTQKDLTTKPKTIVIDDPEMVQKYNIIVKFCDQALELMNKNKHEHARILLQKISSDTKKYLPLMNDIYAEMKQHLGLCLIQTSNFQEAIVCFEECLNIWGNNECYEVDIATVFGSIGLCHFNLGNYDTAIKYHTNALNIQKDKYDNESLSLNDLGVCYELKEDYEKAIQYHKKALELQINKDPQCESHSLSNLGNCFKALGKYTKALNYYEKALKIKEIDECSKFETLANLGSIYASLGDYKKTIDIYEAVLKYKRDTGDRYNTAIILNNLGSHYDSFGEYTKSEQIYQEALEIQRSIPDNKNMITTLQNLGKNRASRKRYQEAVSCFKELLKMELTTSEKAEVFNDLGVCYLHLECYEDSTDNYIFAMELQDENNKLGKAVTLKYMGKLFDVLGRYDKSLDCFKTSLDINNEIGERMDVMTTHCEIALIYTKQNQKSEARESFEEFFKIYQEMKEKHRQEKFFVAFKQFRSEELNFYLNFLIQQENYEEALTKIVNDKIECKKQYFNGTSVIYHIIDNKSIGIWIMKGRKFKHFKKIDSIEDVNIFTGFSFSRCVENVLNEEFDENLRFFGDKTRNEEKKKKVEEKMIFLEKCYETFIDPIKIFLPADEVFYIVAHQSISMLPFSAFRNNPAGKFFIEEYTYAFCDSFENIDFHFDSFNNLNNKSKCLFVSNPKNNEKPLSNATEEVQDIMKMLKLDSSIVLDQEDAKKEKIIKILSEQPPPIFHVAAHTDSESKKPEIYHEEYAFRGSIECERDTETDNVKIFAYEILEIDFSKCEMVVLNTCESGQGKITNDGILGLNLAFSKSGASTVICSLWKIDDASAKSLMVSFYKNLKKGKSKIESLREATLLEMKKDRGAIEKWASMVLFGHHDELKSKFIFKE
eukprot:gene8907-855_t